ncbi:MAG: mechanosensitive ion channel [Alphaproteobacteria bacterium]|nr:mechanosensitive ion channel [Alphaproteobacteria bacterium]
MRLIKIDGAWGRGASRAGCSGLVLFLWLLLSVAPARGAEASIATPPMDNMMSSQGWLQQIAIKLEDEAIEDIHMLPETPGALAREWRSFDRRGSALGALVDLGWVALAACLAMLAQSVVQRALSIRIRRLLRRRPEEPSLGLLLRLLLCDLAGLGVFSGVFIYSRHWLMNAGVGVGLIILSVNVLIRWRVWALIIGIVLRPDEPAARLIDLPDGEARRLAWFLSATILVVIILVGFGRYYGLMDQGSGASHVLGLLVAIIVCGLYVLIVSRVRIAAEALIRGRTSGTLVAALRAAIARAWLTISLTAIAGLFLFFVFGLSLGLLSYYYGVTSTVAVLFVLLVLERLIDRGWHEVDQPVDYRRAGTDTLMAYSIHRILQVLVPLMAALGLVWIWLGAIELPEAQQTRALHSTMAALATLLIAYVAWVLCQLAIDRNLQGVGTGPKLPGTDEETESAPGSRLQTMLPLLRAAFGILVAVIAALVVLSRLGIDTAPLIAGAGVFGLAISFGSQSLVRDIISGLFYMWDDAFRVGEYIDTGRLKGTVEKLGIRSLKLRHHNGPLHTIPYGQLGAVTNLSRDFATVKFNLKLEPGTDIELVRRTAKQTGLAMQQDPEIAAEVMLPVKLQGIAEITENAVVARFKFTARPVKPSWVQREYLKRMYQVFAEKGIAFASGALTLQTAPYRPVAAPGEIPGAVLPLAEPSPKSEPQEVSASAGGIA